MNTVSQPEQFTGNAHFDGLRAQVAVLHARESEALREAVESRQAGDIRTAELKTAEAQRIRAELNQVQRQLLELQTH